MKYLTLDDIKIQKPDFKTSKFSKTQTITNWLIEWVKHSLEYGIADYGDFIPNKKDLAIYLDVSSATVQNSIRQARELGYFTSRQSIGTAISDLSDIKNQDELLIGSVAECKIKKIIIDEKISIETPIFSIKELSLRTDISKNTIRQTLENMCQRGYLEKIKSKGNKYLWIYKKEVFLTHEEISNGIKDENFTLVHQMVGKIQKYIEKTYSKGDKIPSNTVFSAMFNVSIKTVNDAMKILNSKRIILSRRGRWGTVYLGNEKNFKTSFITSERKKVVNSQNYVYSWQKALSHLKKHIIQNYQIGDKIAPIRQLANILNVSPNTIRRALSDLFKSGYLVTKRGKTGGIFIVDMPEPETDSYKWIALNPEAIRF